MMKNKRTSHLLLYFPLCLLSLSVTCGIRAQVIENQSLPSGQVLDWSEFSSYIHDFNRDDEELYVQHYPNHQAEEFLRENIPYFSCPDKELERTYYFRWWTYRKHIKSTPDGFVITEFHPDVPWAGKHNTISCPAAHHFYEGRWLHNPQYLKDYAWFWFTGGGSLRTYSFWAPHSILAFASVNNDTSLVKGLLPHFISNFKAWEEERMCKDGLFWQADGRDGMEVSVGGSGKRATINSYMAGDAKAIAQIAGWAGDSAMANEFRARAETINKLILSRLWDEDSEFFKTLPLSTTEIEQIPGIKNDKSFTRYISDNPHLLDVRELHGYTPWYFGIPENRHSVAWKFLLSQEGFRAPYGPTTAEQSHPGFKVVYEGHECQWNGPSWPFATSVTLKAMANLLRDYDQDIVTREDFMELLLTYSNSHRRINEKGKKVCWIDENLNPFTGDWIARTLLKARSQLPDERGKDYNHSAFCDFIISDLVGVRPEMGNRLSIQPLVPQNHWDWFCLDRVKYHGRKLTIIWDKDGSKYNLGKGFSVYVDGRLMHRSVGIEKIEIPL